MKKLFLTFAFVLTIFQLMIAQAVENKLQNRNSDKTEMTAERAIKLFLNYSGNRIIKQGLISKQQLDSILINYWNSNTGQYNNGIRHYYTYNHAADCILDIQNQWNYSTSVWEKSNKREMTYDANHNKTLEIISEKSLNSNSWELSRKLEFTYNTSGTLLSYSTYLWSTNNNWEKAYKSEFFLNINNLPDSSYYSKKMNNSNQWELKNIYKYQYNANFDLLNQSTYSLNATTNQWEKSYHKENIYDSNGWLVKDYSGMYFSATLVWDTSMMVVHNNDAMGVDTLSIIYFRFAAYGGSWKPQSKMQKQFDAHNNLTFFLKSNWDSYNSQWEYNKKEIRNFDNNYLKSDLVLPQDYYFNTKVLDAVKYSWSLSNMLWENNEQRNYYYSPDATSIQDVQGSKFGIYPNPSSDYIRIDLGKEIIVFNFKLYNATGKLLISKTKESNQLIDIHQLNSGVYYYTIEIEQKEFNGKLIKL